MTESSQEDEWPYPPHYVVLKCPECGGRTATAHRVTKDDYPGFPPVCLDCFQMMEDPSKQIVEKGPAVE